MSSLKIEADLDNYSLLEPLGQGTYGMVYRGLEISTGREVAIKRTKSDNLKEGLSAVSLREICFLKTLRHPNIVSLYSVVYSDNSLDLVFELLCCDLRSYIEQINGPVPEPLIKLFLRQILMALHFCHSNRVLHRDLKPQNLLIDKNFNIKIADFGLARSFQVPVRPYTPCVQTLWYRAPEVLLGAKSYTTAIDIWSVGCILLEMLSMFPPFTGSTERDVIYSIFQKLGTPNEEVWPGVTSFNYYCNDFPGWTKVNFSHIYTQLSPDASDLLMKMLKMNPDQRISASEALNHVTST
jgi:serine/threonine protein kinase